MVGIGQIVLLGDSLTQMSWMPGGTAAALADRYQRRFDVINRGFYGYNSEWGYRFAREVLPEWTDLRLLVVWYGANDAHVEGYPFHVPIDKFKQNLETIVSVVPLSTRIILVSPPCYSPRGRARDIKVEWIPGVTILERTPEQTQSYGEAVRQVVQKLAANDQPRHGRIGFCDIHSPMESKALELGRGDREVGLATLLQDGVHLTAAGYKIVTSQLLRVIEDYFPELNNEPLLYPDHMQVDHADPISFFGH